MNKWGYYQTLYIFTLKSLTINARNVLRLTCTDQHLLFHLNIYNILVTMNGITIFFQFNTRHIKDNDTVSSFKLPCKGFLYHNNKIIDNPISIIHFVY